MAWTAGPLKYVFFSVVCAGALGAGAAGGLVHDDGRIAEGLYVDQIDVGGLTAAEAVQRVTADLRGRSSDRLELRFEHRRWSLQDSKFGRLVLIDQAVREAYQRTRGDGFLDRARTRLRLLRHPEVVPVKVSVDRPRLEDLLGQLAAEIDREPRDAQVSNVIGRQLFFLPEADGYRLNILKTAEQVVADGTFPPPARVDLVIDKLPPKVHIDELRRSLNTVLAVHVTNMSHGYTEPMRSNRAHNVRLLLARLNGRVLLPGEEWSFNDRLGERRAEDGFKSSIIFMRRPDGSIEERWSTGGGICQLATTIFNSALKANLKITQRSNHSKPVHYAQVGRDATVYYGVVDLRFRNDLSHPILLWGELRSNLDLVISIIGDRADDFEVDLESAAWYGKTGRGGSLWRTVRTPDGQALKEREHICDSYYPYEKQKQADPVD